MPYFFNDKVDQLSRLSVGDDVTVEYTATSRSWQGNDGNVKWFHNISGQKIDLNFDIDTLRITDSEEQSEDNDQPQTRGSQILNSLTRKSTIDQDTGEIRKDDPTEGAVVKASQAKVESTKLRQLLNNLPENL